MPARVRTDAAQVHGLRSPAAPGDWDIKQFSVNIGPITANQSCFPERTLNGASKSPTLTITP